MSHDGNLIQMHRWVHLDEALELLGLPRSTFYRRVKRGQFERKKDPDAPRRVLYRVCASNIRSPKPETLKDRLKVSAPSGVSVPNPSLESQVLTRLIDAERRAAVAECRVESLEAELSRARDEAAMWFDRFQKRGLLVKRLAAKAKP